MLWLSMSNLGRQLRGRPFRSAKLERDFFKFYQISGVRLAYVYAWIGAASFSVFSLTELVVYGRGVTDEVQLIRAVVVAALVAGGL
jgi:hypothetical protein